MRIVADRAGSRLSLAGLFLVALALGCASDKSVTEPETSPLVAIVNGSVVDEFFIEQPGATVTAVVRDDQGNVLAEGTAPNSDADGQFTLRLEVDETAPFMGTATLTAAYDASSGSAAVRLRFGRDDDETMPPDTATVLIMIE